MVNTNIVILAKAAAVPAKEKAKESFQTKRPRTAPHKRKQDQTTQKTELVLRIFGKFLQSACRPCLNLLKLAESMILKKLN